MKIEEFKNLCKVKTIEESIQKKNFIEKYNKLKKEQIEYGESYTPIPDSCSNNHLCPNCKNRLYSSLIDIKFGLNGSKETRFYYCNCGYEYAW